MSRWPDEEMRMLNFSSSSPLRCAVRTVMQECLRCKAQIHGALEAVNAYTGCADVIRHSMSAPGDHSAQRAAFDALLPNVDRIASLHATSQASSSEKLVGYGGGEHFHFFAVEEMRGVCAPSYTLQRTHFDHYDRLVTLSQIQNDFAFYKRLMPRMVASSDYTLEQLTVSDRHAGTISMFIAENMPLTVALSTALRDNTTASRTANIIAQVANLCCGTVARADGYRQDATLRQLLLGMTSAVVLYDRITIEGVFARGGGVGVSRCIKVLNKHGGDAGLQLRNCIMYATKHFNSETTPNNIRRALQA
ncbi:hypothetical protein JKP88DRAFT_263847 [Tribonema minus]|uniref:CYRIA/CYRIB Rac1 binding domain-containing protein n=1 Tax=Tribonema minus TaxID=303371 RepID=A0A835YT34_9STRA|nr:hypothetical protein JKP88DRAFT_263847 [Tribonema minus]